MATSTQRDEDREQARAEKLEALHQTLTAQVAELVDSEAWQAMLRAAARFHRYSFGNVCMILAQRPTATQVAGFQTWRSLGRSVTKGEKGIAILAPVTYKTKPTAEPHHGPDEPHDEKPDATGARRLHGFKVEYVFDPLSRDSMSRLVVAGRRVLIEYLRARGLVRFRLFGGPFEPLPLVRRRPARAGQMRATRPAWAADVRATNRTPGPSLARHRS
jgi:hypothetical protein